MTTAAAAAALLPSMPSFTTNAGDRVTLEPA
jgi:hypothetical protein